MKKNIPHFRRSELYPEWGRSPEGEEGVQYYHVAGTYTPFNQLDSHVNLFEVEPEPHAHLFVGFKHTLSCCTSRG